jgi:hypothetical protein
VIEEVTTLKLENGTCSGNEMRETIGSERSERSANSV